MRRNLAWRETDALARAQLTLLQTLGDQVNLAGDDRRRALSLTAHEWQTWTDFLMDGPLPAEPPLPEMLQRIGAVAHAISISAERRCVVAERCAHRLVDGATHVTGSDREAHALVPSSEHWARSRRVTHEAAARRHLGRAIWQ